MLSTRIIPALLLSGPDLIKTTRYKKPKYIGDPINAVRIFNDLEVDELFLLDIHASKEKHINFNLLQEISNEAFIPLCYGGGVSNTEQMKFLYKMGVEKISLNSHALSNPNLISEASNLFGRQSVVVSIDVKKDYLGNYHTYTDNGRKKNRITPFKWAIKAEKLGAGEILINSINNDGMMKGYDIELLKKVSSSVSIPVIGCGGAGNTKHMQEAAQQTQVSGLAAGSMFVFYNSLKGVLINYPKRSDLEKLFKND